jgi:protein-S-isoprenylcysteine O-methyltransferase Ste14
MALIHSFEKSGNWLFRHRGELPIVLFLLAVPVVYFTDTSWLPAHSTTVLTWVSIALSVKGFLIRSYSIGTTPKGTSGRNTRAGQIAESLNITGIYSIVRHPLYLGNYLMWTGIVLFTFNFSFVVIVSLAFWLYYERIMFAEERFLERKFGQTYLDWSLTTPAFIPCYRSYVRSVVPFSLRSVLRREYSGMMATVTGFVFIDLLRQWFESGMVNWYSVSIYVFAVSLLITVILRSLKHYTGVLSEKDRS